MFVWRARVICTTRLHPPSPLDVTLNAIAIKGKERRKLIDAINTHFPPPPTSPLTTRTGKGWRVTWCPQTIGLERRRAGTPYSTLQKRRARQRHGRNVVTVICSNTPIRSGKRLAVAAVGVSDLSIVETVTILLASAANPGRLVKDG